MRALVAALSVLRPARPIHALVSILGDKEWPDMLVQLDQAIDRGVLTIAPTAAARGGTSTGSGDGSATPHGRRLTPSGLWSPIFPRLYRRCRPVPGRCW